MTSQALTIDDSQPRAGWLLKVTLLVTSTLTVMAAATIAPALPAMQSFFNEVPNADLLVRLVLTLPALFIVIGAPLAGAIIDRYGRKRLLVFSVLLYGLAGGSGFVLQSLPLILIGRALLGLAVAGVITSVTTLIADYFSGPARAQFLGRQAAFIGLGGVAFLSLGGFLAEVNWQVPFLIYLVAFIVLPFVVFVIYEPQRKQKPATTVTTATQERLPVRLLSVIYVTMLITQIAFYLIPVHLPFYLQTLVNATASQAGLAVAGLSLSYALGSFTFGWINQRFGHLSVLSIAFTVTAIGYVIIMLAQSWLGILPGLALGGFGLGWVVPNLNVWVANSVAEASRGRALGGLTTALFLGQFLSPIVLQPFLQAFGDGGAYGAVAGVLLLFAGTFYLGRKRLAAFLKV